MIKKADGARGSEQNIAAYAGFDNPLMANVEIKKDIEAHAIIENRDLFKYFIPDACKSWGIVNVIRC